jgi:hypothetical protein
MLLSTKKNIIFMNRLKIHDILVSKVFDKKGGRNFTKISNDCIMKTFDIYDLIIFNNQIKNKLQEEGNSIKFSTTSNRKDVGSICKIISILGKNGKISYIYNFCINIKIILVLIKLEEIKQLINVKKIDKVYCFQIILEHAIVDLLMIMWNYMYRDYYGPNYNIYKPYGRLYNCIIKNYFGYSYFSKIKLSDVQGLLNKYIQKPVEILFQDNILIMKEDHQYNSILYSKKDINFKENIINPGLLENWSNSCYIDSLIMSLFLGDGIIPKKAILEVDVTKIDYKSWASEEANKEIKERKKKVFKKLSRTLGYETEDNMKDFAKKLQESLIDDYEKLIINKDIFKCIKSRNILYEYIPDMKINGINFCSYPVGDLYETLADIFPELKMKYIPCIVNSFETGIYNKPSVIEERKSFLFWDFMTPIEEEGVTPLWDIIETPMLIFQNGLSPAISDYGSIKSEKIIIRDLIPGEFEIINEKMDTGQIKTKYIPKIEARVKLIEKVRIFDEYIINERYRLFAVIRNHGDKPKSSGIEDFGGGHYTAYIRPFFDNQNWYNYNDMKPNWELTKNNGELPLDTFLDSNYSRPELLFYQKIKSTIL